MTERETTRSTKDSEHALNALGIQVEEALPASTAERAESADREIRIRLVGLDVPFRSILGFLCKWTAAGLLLTLLFAVPVCLILLPLFVWLTSKTTGHGPSRDARVTALAISANLRRA